MAKSALPIIAAGGAALLLTSSGGRKKGKKGKRGRWGVGVSKDCKTITVYNPGLLMDFLFNAYKELIEVDPDLGPLQITDALFGDILPNCSGFPERPESPAVVEFYAFIARHVSMFMVDDPSISVTPKDMVDEATSIAFGDWYTQWRDYPTSDLPSAPSDQVAFSGDFSNYKIGPDWYSNNIKPFVENELSAGRSDSIFENYVDNRGVQVGKFVRVISDLPEDRKSVQDFLDKLEDAIEKAMGEVSP